MDLSYYIFQNGEPSILQNRIGLYCAQPTGMLATPYRHIYRCGVAGSKETRDDANNSSFRSRLAMYYGNWIGDGRIYYALTAPRSMHNGWSDLVLDDDGDPRDARPDYARGGQTLAKVMERRYHERLLALGATRARSDRSEWFEIRDLDIVRQALIDVGVRSTLVMFHGNGPTTHTKVTRSDLSADVLAKLKRVEDRISPRLQLQYAEGDERAKRLIARNASKSS